MTVVVNGCSGYIGSVLCVLLELRGHQVIRTNRPRVPVGIGRFDSYVYLWGASKAMSDITDAQIDAEVRFVRTVAERLNGARLIYTSSCAVYGNGGDSTFYENATINPQCRYGAVKAACEGAVWEYGNHCIIRCGAVCGPSPRFRSDLAINAMVTDACKGRDIRVIGAQDWRPHINIYDACMSYIRVIESKYDSLKVLNRVAWNSRMIDVANEIARVTNARICVESDTTGRSYRVGTNWPDPYGDMQIHTSILDLTRWYGSGGFLEWMK